MTIRTLINRGTFIGDPSADTPYAGALKLNALVSKTYVATAAQFGGVTKEATYTNTIAAAVADGVTRVLIPEKYDLDNSAGLPYNASLVTFNPSVVMLREGGPTDMLDARAYGCAGDNVTDDGAALNKLYALAPTVTAQGISSSFISWPIFLPEGIYRTSVTIGPALDYIWIAGPGKRRSASIVCTTNNIPVLQWGGYMSKLTDVDISYLNEQPATNTAAIGLALYNPSWATVDRISVRHSGIGIGIAQTGCSIGGGDGTTNYLNVCGFRNIYIQYSYRGLDLRTFGAAGSEGSHFESIVMFGRNDATVSYNSDVACYLSGHTEGIFNHLSIDGTNPTSVIELDTCDNMVFNSLHMEALTPRQNFGAYVFMNGVGTINISGWTIFNNSLLVGNLANEYALIRLVSGSRYIINGLRERGNTVTVPNFSAYSVASADGGTAVWARGVRADGITRLGFLAPNQQGIIRQWNTQVDYCSEDRGDANVILTLGLDAPVQLFSTPLTAARTITMPAQGVVSPNTGDFWRIVRTAAATGPGTLTTSGGTPNIFLAPGTFAEYRSGGGSFRLVNYGVLGPGTPIVTLTDAATIATEASLLGPTGEAQVILTASGHVIGIPTNPFVGQRIMWTIIQDGTGGRALTWNAVFKNAWSDAGNTLNKRSSIAHIYDGTNWNQDGAQTPYV